MLTRTVALLLTAVLCSTVIASDGNTTDLTQVKRVLAVSEKLSFSSKGGIRIRTWQQHSDSNVTGASVDADEWSLTRVANLWSDKCEKQDLKNVAIIRNNGRRVDIVDLQMIRNRGRKDVNVKRGDIVIFLYPKNVE